MVAQSNLPHMLQDCFLHPVTSSDHRLSNHNADNRIP